MKKYKASLSLGMLFSTIFFFLIFSWAIYKIIIELWNVQQWTVSSLTMLIVGGLIIIALLHAFTSQIKYIGLTGDSIIIKKMVGEIVIPKKEIIEINRKKSIMTDIRIWGISGIFGHMGLFWNSKNGRYQAYVRDGKSMIQIKTINKTYVVSCDDLGTLLEDL